MVTHTNNYIYIAKLIKAPTDDEFKQFIVEYNNIRASSSPEKCWFNFNSNPITKKYISVEYGCETMNNLLEQKRKMDWYDPDKVAKMSFDDKEWGETCKILDDPNIDQTTKNKALEDYITLLFKQAGVKGY